MFACVRSLVVPGGSKDLARPPFSPAAPGGIVVAWPVEGCPPPPPPLLPVGAAGPAPLVLGSAPGREGLVGVAR